MSEFRGYDAWKTSGRYSRSLGRVTCPACKEDVAVSAETEYGLTEWSPAECPKCGYEFTGEEPWEDDEPPEPPMPWED